MNLVIWSRIQGGTRTGCLNKTLHRVLGRGIAPYTKDYHFRSQRCDDYDRASTHMSWGRRRGPTRYYHGLRLLLEHDSENGTDAEEGADAVAFAHGAPFVEGRVFDGGLFGGADLRRLRLVSLSEAMSDRAVLHLGYAKIKPKRHAFPGLPQRC